MTQMPSGFRGRIHRGSQQIGGTCVELEAGGERILLDLGLPLDADELSETLLPDIAGHRSHFLSRTSAGKLPDSTLVGAILSPSRIQPALRTVQNRSTVQGCRHLTNTSNLTPF